MTALGSAVTGFTLAVAFVAGLLAGWWGHKCRHEVTETRALDAHLLAVKADVFRESGERLYDEKAALEAAVTPELTRLQRLKDGWRELALRGTGRAVPAVSLTPSSAPRGQR